MNKEKFDYIARKNLNYSKFVQEVSYNLLWQDELKNRSVTVVKCKNKQDEKPKPKLTPQKVNAAAAMLKENIRRNKPETFEEVLNVLFATVQVENYIKTNIQNLNKPAFQFFLDLINRLKRGIPLQSLHQLLRPSGLGNKKPGAPIISF